MAHDEEEQAPVMPVVHHEALPVESRLMARQMQRMAQRLKQAEDRLAVMQERAEKAEEMARLSRPAIVPTTSKTTDGTVMSYVEHLMGEYKVRIAIELDGRECSAMRADKARRAQVYNRIGDHIRRIMLDHPFADPVITTTSSGTAPAYPSKISPAKLMRSYEESVADAMAEAQARALAEMPQYGSDI